MPTLDAGPTGLDILPFPERIMKAVVLIAMFATTASAQDTAGILRTMHERQQARWQSVRNYTVIQRMAGDRMSQVPLYHERLDVDGEAAFRIVPEAEWSRATTGLSAEQNLAIAEQMASGLEVIGDVHMREVGGPLGAHIKGMTNDMAFFLREMKKYDEDETRVDAAAGARSAAAFRRRARVTGREAVGGRDAHVIRADNLQDVPMPAQPGGPKFVLHTVTLWVDAEHHVPLRLAMEGRVDGSDTPVVIELREEEYRSFGPLYEPTKRTMRLAGLMEATATDPRRKRELQRSRDEAAKAQAQLAGMEDKLARMPAAQRRLIESQMERAKAQLQMMANDGVFEVQIALEVIRINEGPPIGWRPTN